MQEYSKNKYLLPSLDYNGNIKEYLLNVSYGSPDETKVGAVIIDDKGDVLIAKTNTLPNDTPLTPERLENDIKHLHVIHAEANVIATAAKYGIPLIGTTLYVSCKCICLECAKLIINSGIKEVCCPPPDDFGRWKESTEKAVEMLLSTNNIKVTLSREFSFEKEQLNPEYKYFDSINKEPLK